VNADGWAKAARNLAAVLDAGTDAAREAAADRAAEAARDATALAPKRTGRLAASYTAEREAARPGMDAHAVQTTLWRAHFAEFGTREQRAQPHLRPAMARLAADVGPHTRARVEAAERAEARRRRPAGR
jgi:HK97 gp10 family phage protein